MKKAVEMKMEGLEMAKWKKIKRQWMRYFTKK